ncbi:MAG: radical SAM protein [Desulfocapsaceae bacterium]|nr:radical SAM protein [Desulfocapsaceae bacterium]
MKHSEARTVGFKAGERNVFFHILTACNLRCKHCYINTAQHGSATLSKETIEHWLKLFYEPSKKSNLVFLGGEPTLHPDLAASIKTAKEMGYSVTVDSNGYLLNDFLNATNPDLLDYLSFSLDGPDPEVNDPIRGQGVFEICVDNIKKAVALGYRVSVIYTVSNYNIDHLHRMIPLLNELKVKRFFIQVIGLRGESAKLESEANDQNEESLQVERQKWLDTVPEVAKQGAAAGLHVTYPKVFLEEHELFECAGEAAENYFIFPNGRVYQCPLCEDYALHTYTIENDELVANPDVNEKMMFPLKIAEGCVMNKLLQPDTIEYDDSGKPLSRISCCLLKKEIY